jgi:hypothetical protein
MKTAPAVLLLTVAALAAMVAADDSSSATGVTESISVVDGATQNVTSVRAPRINCKPRPKDGLSSWYYNSKSDGPYKCTTKGDTDEWSMLSAYRSGGIEGVHWKYTDNQNDGECLNNWKIYSSDGQSLTATVSGRTTFQGDSRRWCALPVYRSGGVSDKQWAPCVCDID